jgi:hypothetical protein
VGISKVTGTGTRFTYVPHEIAMMATKIGLLVGDVGDHWDDMEIEKFKTRWDN